MQQRIVERAVPRFAGDVTPPARYSADVNAAPRACAGCGHRVGDQCRNPQARWNWGMHSGMQHHLPAAIEWPSIMAEGACGWWKPVP